MSLVLADVFPKHMGKGDLLQENNEAIFREKQWREEEGILRSLTSLTPGVPEASYGFAVQLFYKVLIYSSHILPFCFNLLTFCHLCQIESN